LIDNPARRSQSEKNHQYPSEGDRGETLEEIEAFSTERGVPLYEGLKQAIGEDWLAPAVTTKVKEFVQWIEEFPERSRGPAAPANSRLAVLRQDGVSAEIERGSEQMPLFKDGERR